MGTYLFPGRWHSAGQNVPYTASTESPAQNKRLAHLAGERGVDFILLELALPENAKINNYEALLIQARAWRALESTQARGVGDWWLGSGTQLRWDCRYRVGPAARNAMSLLRAGPLFTELRVVRATPFRYDPRLYPSN